MTWCPSWQFDQPPAVVRRPADSFAGEFLWVAPADQCSQADILTAPAPSAKGNSGKMRSPKCIQGNGLHFP
jgi:hypothetical protein